MPKYRVVLHYNGEYSTRSPYDAKDVEAARFHAQKEQPDARVVVNAEELADVLYDVYEDRKQLRGKIASAQVEIDKLEQQIAALAQQVEGLKKRHH